MGKKGPQRYVLPAASGAPPTDYEREHLAARGLPAVAEVLAAYRAGHVDGWDELAETQSRLRTDASPQSEVHVSKRQRKQRSDAGIKKTPAA